RDPVFDASLAVENAFILGRAIRKAGLSARGSPRCFDARLTAEGNDPQRVEAGARVERARATTWIRDAQLTVKRSDETARASVATIVIHKGAYEIDDLRVEGLGEPFGASGRYSATSASLHASSAGLDLVRAVRFAA